jgi:tetratricopeptide (TPR) repeat protein
MRLLKLLLTLLGLTACLTAQDPVDFDGWMQRGGAAFQRNDFPAAAAAFERAVAADPASVEAQLYLGTSCLQQYVPGAADPANLKLAESAQRAFSAALSIEPQNSLAMASLASLAVNQKRWDDAQHWYEKLLAVEPNNADAYYSMGFIAWSKWYPEYGKARASLGLKLQDPGPMPSSVIKEDLRARFSVVIESGLESLNHALEIKPEYADAMAYINLLVREHADLRDTKEEYERDIKMADEWINKALAAKKAQRERALRSRP